MFIHSDDIWVLREWALGKDVALAKRARTLLALHEGMTQAEVEHQTGCPVRTVARWLSNYRRLGLGGLVNEGARGTAMPMVKKRAIIRFLVRNQVEILTKGRPHEAIATVAKRLGRSEDAIRRVSRLAGIPLLKDHQGRFAAYADEDEQRIGIVGLFLTPTIWIAVFLGSQPWNKDLSGIGSWLIPGKQVRERLAAHGVSPGEPMPLALAIHGSARYPPMKLPVRRRAEAFRQWANTLVYAYPPMAQSLRVISGGDVLDPLIKSLLLMTRPPKLRKGSTTRCLVELTLVQDAEIWLRSIGAQFSEGDANRLLGALRIFATSEGHDNRTMIWCRGS